MLGRGLLVTAALLIAAGCSSGGSTATGTTTAPHSSGPVASTTSFPVPKEKAEDFLKRHLTQQAEGQWGLAYSDLLPQQQAVISRATFVNCGAKILAPTLKNVSVLKVYTENTPTPGAGDLDSTAVTLKVTFEGVPSVTKTVHAFNVGGTWKASVDQANFDAQSKGQCAP